MATHGSLLEMAIQCILYRLPAAQPVDSQGDIVRLRLDCVMLSAAPMKHQPGPEDIRQQARRGLSATRAITKESCLETV